MIPHRLTNQDKTAVYISQPTGQFHQVSELEFPQFQHFEPCLLQHISYLPNVTKL